MLSQHNIRLYFENPVGRLLEHPGNFAIVQYHPGRRALPELQSFLTHTRQLLLSRNWHKLVNDQRHMTAFTEEERAWIMNNWFSQIAHHELTLNVAALLPHDVFARLASNLVMHEARQANLIYRLFEDDQEAIAWLQQIA